MPENKQVQDVIVLYELYVSKLQQHLETLGFGRSFICDLATMDLHPMSKTTLFMVSFETAEFLTALLARISEQCPSSKVLLLSDIKQFDLSILSAHSPASDCVIGWNCFAAPQKEDLDHAVQSVERPATFLIQMPYPVSSWSTEERDANDVTLLLTDREMEVLILLAEGASNRRIAEELYITENTAKTHVRRILEKLQLNSRTKVALLAMETGLSKRARKKLTLQENT